MQKLTLLNLISLFVSMHSLTAAFPVMAATPEPLTVTSSSLRDGQRVDKKYSGDGKDYSPPLSWSKGPDGTKSYAISCDDRDAPSGAWWHWIIFNIKPSTQLLAENVPKSLILDQGIKQGRNDFSRPGYNGPAPPPGKPHHYFFKVYALDTYLSLKAGCDKEAFKNAIKGHVLSQGQLTALYNR